MIERFDWVAADVVPPREDVLRLQGIPEGAPLSLRISSLLDAAVAIFQGMAEPRAIACDISAEEFTDVYRGDGRNSHETPLENIYPNADRLALFAATVGGRVTSAISDLFARNDLALGSMLDSVASAAADRLADLPRLHEFAGGDPGSRVLAYSPGYCGWDVSGQRALFAALHPERIGITLNAGCLMQPLKSVSGVLVAGPGALHSFHPTYAFCSKCREKQCRDRIALVSGRRSR